jgi:hypothetical protein
MLVGLGGSRADQPVVAGGFFRREARQGTYVMHFAASGEEALELLGGEHRDLRRDG